MKSLTPYSSAVSRPKSMAGFIPREVPILRLFCNSELSQKPQFNPALTLSRCCDPAPAGAGVTSQLLR